MKKTSLQTCVRLLLAPFSVLYWGIVSFRNFLFEIDFLKSTSFQVPVIVVGNLSVGGTGKSPQIEYLIRLLKNNYQVATLSRGYKRKSKGFLRATTATSVEEIGDEPFQFYKNHSEITVAVDANRVHGIQQLLKKVPGLEVVLLDDAFQHRYVKAKLSILLTDYNDLYVKDCMLPSGTLRESRNGAKRAEIIVVTKCPPSLSENLQKKTKEKIAPQQHQNVFFTTISYADQIVSKSNKVLVSELTAYDILLVTGIANPKPLLKKMESLRLKFKHLKFPDHYNFEEKDLLRIQKEYLALSSEKKILLTTEKDYTRLKEIGLPLYYWGIETRFLNNGSSFDALVLEVL
jgi:tetraacyldisaccharide 4'-kinase